MTTTISANFGPQKRKTVTVTTNYAWRGEQWVPISKTETEEEYDVDPPVQPIYPNPPAQPWTPAVNPPYVTYCADDASYQEPSPMGYNNGGR